VRLGLSNSIKPSVTPTIGNLSSLRICVFGCIYSYFGKVEFGACIDMKMHWNNFDGYGSDGSVARNLLAFITATVHSLPVVPSLESLSHSPDSRILFGPARGPLTSKSFASFSKNYSVNYCIDVCDIPQFRAPYSYNNGTI